MTVSLHVDPGYHPGPLEEQSVLLTPKLSLLPPVHVVYETLFLFQAPSVARKDDLDLSTSLPLPSEG